MNPELVLVAAILGGTAGLCAFILGWQRYRLRRSRLDPVVMAHEVSAKRVLATMVTTLVAAGIVPAIAVPLDPERRYGLVVMLGVLGVSLVGIAGAMFGPWLRSGTLALDRDARSLTLERKGQPRLRIDLRLPFELTALPTPDPGVVIAVEVHQGDTLIAFSYPWPKLLDPDAEPPQGRQARRMPGPRLDLAARGIHEGIQP